MTLEKIWNGGGPIRADLNESSLENIICYYIRPYRKPRQLVISPQDTFVAAQLLKDPRYLQFFPRGFTVDPNIPPYSWCIVTEN